MCSGSMGMVASRRGSDHRPTRHQRERLRSAVDPVAAGLGRSSGAGIAVEVRRGLNRRRGVGRTPGRLTTSAVMAAAVSDMEVHGRTGDLDSYRWPTRSFIDSCSRPAATRRSAPQRRGGRGAHRTDPSRDDAAAAQSRRDRTARRGRPDNSDAASRTPPSGIARDHRRRDPLSEGLPDPQAPGLVDLEIHQQTVDLGHVDRGLSVSPPPSTVRFVLLPTTHSSRPGDGVSTAMPFSQPAC